MTLSYMLNLRFCASVEWNHLNACDCIHTMHEYYDYNNYYELQSEIEAEHASVVKSDVYNRDTTDDSSMQATRSCLSMSYSS
jgi:hypothetical protein